MSNQKMGKAFEILGFGVIICFWIFKIHLGIHTDEVLFVALGDMVLKGADFFRDIWTTLQFSAAFLAPLEWIYKTFWGSTDGMILYLRFCFVIIQILMSIWFYSTIKKIFSERKAYLISILNLVYSFHWNAITYKSLLYWGCCIIVLSLVNYHISNKKRYVCYAVMGLAVATLPYCTAVVMIIPMLIYFLKNDKNKKKSVGILTLTGITLVCIFMIYICYQASFSEIIIGISKFLVDDAHSESVINKFVRLGSVFLGLVIISYFPIVIGYWGNQKNNWLKRLYNVKSLAVVALIYFIVMCAARPASIGWARAWYTLLIICCWFPFLIQKYKLLDVLDQEQIIIIKDIFIYHSVAMISAIFLATNQGIAIVAHGFIFMVMALVLCVPEEREWKYLLVVIVGLFMFVFSICLQSQSSCGTVFEKRIKVESGPASGIWVNPDWYNEYSNLQTATEKYVTADDRILFWGNGFTSVGYLLTDAFPATCSPWRYGDVKGTLLFDYYKMDVHDMPTVIVVPNNYIENFQNVFELNNMNTYLEKNYTEHVLDELGYTVFAE